MSDWQQGDISSDGIKVHYHCTGQGDKPPLLLSTGLVTMDCVDTQAQELGRLYVAAAVRQKPRPV